MTTTTVTDYLPPDDLIETVSKMGVIKYTLNYSDYIGEMGYPPLSEKGITDANTIAEIKKLSIRVDQDLDTAKGHANSYFNLVNVQLLTVYDTLVNFASGPETQAFYKAIVDDYADVANPDKKNAVIHGLQKISDTAGNNIIAVKEAYGDALRYNVALSDDHSRFQMDYKSQQQVFGKLTDAFLQLDEKLASLRNQISANNEKVSKVALDEGLNIVENGVSVASDVASGQEADAVKTGAIMGFKFAKAAGTIIVLDAQTISLISEVADLSKQLTQVENDLQMLNNVGSILTSLTDGGTYSTDTLTALENYWKNLQSYIDSLIVDIKEDKPVELSNPAHVAELWNSQIAAPIKGYLDAQLPKEPARWVTGEVTFDTLDNLGKYTS